jgi:hypothetical protein
MVEQILKDETITNLVNQGLLNTNQLRESLSWGEPKKIIRKILSLVIEDEELASSSALGYNIQQRSIPPLLLEAIQRNL